MDLVGRWRILEMDRDAIELLGPGFFEFSRNGTGRFRSIAVEGWMDRRPVETGPWPGRGVHLGRIRRVRSRKRSRHRDPARGRLIARPHLRSPRRRLSIPGRA